MVAFYRLLFSVILLGLPMIWQRPQRPSPKDLGLALLSGLFLAAHFATWFFSLTLTSVASSTVLVSTHPFMVMLYGYLAWGERTRGWALAGAGLAVTGAMLVGWGDFRLDSAALLGDLLALLGAVTVSGYFLLGRALRQRMDAIVYSTTAYTSAAAALLLAAIAWGSPFGGFAVQNWWIFAALAVFPTLFGHTLFNWALKYVSASAVSVSILGEPIGATVLAWLLWRTAPGPAALAGGILILAGIILYQRQRPQT